MNGETMSTTPINDWIKNIGNPKHPLIIAGPCSAESEEQMLTTAKQLQGIDKTINVFRAGIWKPRTRPGYFEGVGEIGLKWLKKVKEETNMLTTTEVANAEHVELALKHGVDILWIGARTSVNPFSVQEIADSLKGVDIPVMIKNPINADLPLWMGAIERFEKAGLDKLIAIHRGFSSYEKTKYRNTPNWKIPIELKRRCPDLPIICDPSHIAGTRSLIEEVCQKAMDVDFDGLMVETHFDPSVALSDAAQQVTPESLNQILTNIELRAKTSTNNDFEQNLDQLRAKINRIDSELIEGLAQRMRVAGEIGEAKLQCNVQPLQLDRMNELMKNRIDSGVELGLSEKFMNELYQIIHTESIKIQTDLMHKSKK
jgi:chorismate mutase